MKSPEQSRPQFDQEHPTLFDMPEQAAEKEMRYELLANPDLRYKYVRYTEALIARAVNEDVDTMIFLDKSARPVSWLMKSLWPTLGFRDFDENNQPIPVKMPDIKYVNFDREQWAAVMGRSEVREGKGITLDGVHPDTIDSLTGLFAEKNLDVHEYIAAEDKTMFDEKNILIVDEVAASGDTLTMAKAIFNKAFKNANSITGTHWMSPERKMDKRSGGMRNADLPIWYDSTNVFGRLVGNRDTYRSSTSGSMRQRRGAQFLSVRFGSPDKKGLQLRREMQQLGREVAEGGMPVLPNASHRPDDERFEELFMQHVNGLSTKEFSTLRRVSIDENKPFASIVGAYKRERTEA